MKLKLIACEVFFREVCHFAARSNNILDITFIPFGLHDTPEKLRERLQQEIDAEPPGAYEYIALAYGLCSGGTANLVSRDTPIVLPRAHDCITLFLGSRSRYDARFADHPGTYYYTPGWIERKDGEVDQGSVVELKARDRERRFQEYKEKYGEDNAAFLIEQESQWLANYDRAAFINTGVGNVEQYREFTCGVAESHGWLQEEIAGDLSLLSKLVEGPWDPEDFLLVPAGQSIAQSFDDSVVRIRDLS
ncbi:MAG: DUF1638 domain-containing protein [Armatimonadota bacterium]|nr:DUF1638 domain-containing protein [Armatimonadota bacterium]